MRIKIGVVFFLCSFILLAKIAQSTYRIPAEVVQAAKIDFECGSVNFYPIKSSIIQSSKANVVIDTMLGETHVLAFAGNQKDIYRMAIGFIDTVKMSMFLEKNEFSKSDICYYCGKSKYLSKYASASLFCDLLHQQDTYRKIKGFVYLFVQFEVSLIIEEGQQQIWDQRQEAQRQKDLIDSTHFLPKFRRYIGIKK